MSLQSFLGAFCESAGIDEEERAMLDAGSAHAYDCHCDVCKEWWRSVGPDEDGNYGPFTREEIGSQ